MTEAVRGPLVGRGREQEALVRALDGASAGRGSAAMLVGDAGLGKSRLLAWAGERAAERGFTVVWGRAWEAGGAPPYWPIVEALRELLASTDAASLVDAETRAAVIEIVPELDRADLPELAPLDPARARFRLHDAVATLLRSAARERPLLLVLDDLHAADLPSVMLLELLVRAIRRSAIAIVGGYRPVEARHSPAADGIARVSRDAEVLALAPLDRDAVAELVAERLGADKVRLAGPLHASSEGNPLFLVETLRWIALRGDDADPTAMPETVRVVIEERLRSMPAPARELLERAAVLGRKIDLALLAQIEGRSVAVLRSDLAPAVALDVLIAHDERTLAFSHIVLREVVYRALGESRRAELHLRVADALERDPDAISELAHHALAAVPAIDPARCAAIVAGAARHASSTHAFEDAAELLDRALLLDLDGATRCDLWIDLVRARGSARDVEGVRRAYLGAAQIARDLGDAERLAAIALAAGEQLRFGVVDTGLVGILREALAALGTADGPAHARVLARLAAAEQPAEHDPEQPIARARAAIAMARRLDEPRTRLLVLDSACAAMTYFADPVERAPLHEEIAVLAREFGDRPRELRALVRLVHDRLELGDVERADAAIESFETLAARVGHPLYTWSGPFLRGMRATMSGRFAEARERAEEGRALAERVGDSNGALCGATFRAGLLRAAGTSDEMVAHRAELERVAGGIVDPLYVWSCLAGLDARAGRTAAARGDLDRVALHLVRGRPMASHLGDAAAFIGDAERAAVLEPILRPFAHRNHAWGIVSMVMEGPHTHSIANVVAAQGRIDEALQLFEAAVTRARAMGAPPHAAWARHDQARALLRAGRREDALRAADEARGIAERLGMRGLLERLEHLGEASETSHAAGDEPRRPIARVEPTPVEAGASEAPEVVLARSGQIWRLSWGEVEVPVSDSRGVQILAELVSRPDEEVHVLELATDPADERRASDAGDMIDREAAAAYRERVEELQELLAEAEAANDLGRADRARQELDAIEAELRRALGLGGRPRKAGSDVERARINVQRRLKHAIRRIADASPTLGRHLDLSLRTGTFCGYFPRGRPGIAR